MTKGPKTLTSLYDLIEKDYAWRISELSNYRSALITEQNEKAQKAKIRAGVALLYAHWEGFIKQLANWYYEFVSFQSHNVSDLSDSFASIILRAELNTLAYSKKIKDHQRVVRKMFEDMNKKAFFSSKSPIKTSNLKFTVFEDVCILIGIHPTDFEKRYKRKFDRNIQLTIDEDLVEQRNRIAHGEYLPIGLDEFKGLYDIVINGFLYNFKEIVMDCASNRKYLRVHEKATH